MPVRERFAWVWLGVMVVSYGCYFAALAVLQPSMELSNTRQLLLLSGAALLQVVVLGFAALIAWAGRGWAPSPKPDERDRNIERRAAAFAYYVLIAGMILVGCVMPFGGSGWRLVHAAVLAIVIAEIVHYGLVVAAYRRGWHG